MNYPQPPIPQGMPSLGPSQAAAAPSSAPARSLLDLMSDGFYLLMLLKRGQLPSAEAPFVESIQRFLDSTERGAVKLGIGSEDVYAAKYAFCAALDEAMLSQPSDLREEWERNPLQLRLFGEHLAGEHFFDRLEQLRAQGAPRLPSLEVYYYCLLLGFEGKYRLEGPEKLGYLTARLGDEIAYLKGKRAPFAPHWPLPDQIAHRLKREVPVWAIGTVFALVALLGYLGLNTYLKDKTLQALSPYSQVIKVGPESANLTISLP